MAVGQDAAFPPLTSAEMALVKPLALPREYANGDPVFRAGTAEVDFYVVESGEVCICNPNADNAVIAVHGPGHFSGDIDLLTGRPVIVTALAKGPTRLLQVPHQQLRSLLNRVPTLSEKLIAAFTSRRELVREMGTLGMPVVGPARCRATNTLLEFLHRNFVPYVWHDPESPEGRKLLRNGRTRKMPVVLCNDGEVLENPSPQRLAEAAGIWRHCPSQDSDFAIVGAGPAGLAAAVYASSEGLSTVVLDKLGPGGQAGSSSRIENFIGFPAGLTGADLAMRSALQMLKFGAKMVAPVAVESIRPARSKGEMHALTLDCGAVIRCRVVLLALGVRWRELEAKGADRYRGAGIYYACTKVEAELYDGADVAVVGGGNSAGQAAMFLAECCPSRKVRLLVRRELGPSMSEYLIGRIRGSPNILVQEFTEIESVHGDRTMEAVTLRKRQGGTEQVPCAAVFVFIGAEPCSEWLPKEIARDSKGFLLTGTEVVQQGRWPLADRNPCPLETSVPGILAAGDIRSGSTKRVGFAVGDGSLAVTCAHLLTTL